MAGHHHGASAATVDDDGTPPRVDIAAHVETYEAFLGLTKWTIVFIALLLIGMAVFLL